MSDGNASDHSVRQKMTHFAAPAAPSEVTVKQTYGPPIAVAWDHVNFHVVTLHDKLAIVFVCCAADFMTRRQNLQYKIYSQHKLKTDNDYVPKSAQIKLDLAFEKLTIERKALQALSKKHAQIIAECQLKLKSLVIEAGELNTVEKKKLAIIYFVESVHNISEGCLIYENIKDIDEHQCSINVI